MKKQNSDGRMIWSGKAGQGPDGKRSHKSKFGSFSIILVVVAMLTIFLTTSVYAAPEDPVNPDVYIWGEGSISADDGMIITEGYIWGESYLISGGIEAQSYGYAWGE